MQVVCLLGFIFIFPKSGFITFFCGAHFHKDFEILFRLSCVKIASDTAFQQAFAFITVKEVLFCLSWFGGLFWFVWWVLFFSNAEN